MTRAKKRPRIIDELRPRSGQAVVTLDVPRGEVFLEGAKQTLRLVWSAKDRDRRRSVPPGRYRLMAYRHYEGDWTLASAGGTRVLELRADAATAIRLASPTRLSLSATESAGALAINWMARVDAGEGRSFYRGGRRVLMRYRVEDALGALLSEGSLDYG